MALATTTKATIIKSSVALPEQAAHQKINKEETASPLVLFSLIVGIMLWTAIMYQRECAYRNFKNQ